MVPLHRVDNDSECVQRVFFGRGYFHTAGKVNKHNVRIWGSENPNFPVGSMNVLFAVVIVTINSGYSYGYSGGMIVNLMHVIVKWLKEVDYIQDINSTRLDSDTNSKTTITAAFGSSSSEWKLLRWFEGIFSVGGTLGSLYALKVVNQFGRKGGMLMSAFLNIIAVLFSGYSKYFGLALFLYVGRFVSGFQCGLNGVLAPIYIFEVVPTNLRARYSVIYGIFLSFGVISATMTCAYLGNDTFWPLAISLSVFPAIIHLLVLPYCPESPQYLYVKKRNEIASKKSMRWFRGNKFTDEEMYPIRREFYQVKLMRKITLKMVYENRVLRQALVICIFLLISTELTGLFSVLFYYKKFASGSGFYGYIFYCFVYLSPFIVVEIVSRRKLLIGSFVTMSIACLTLCILFTIEGQQADTDGYTIVDILIAAVLLIHIAAYNVGIGPLVRIIPMEYFTTAFVHYPYSFGLSGSWCLQAVLFMYYIPLQEYLGSLSFINIALCNIGIAYFIYSIVPETKNKTIQDVYYSINEYLKKEKHY